MLLNDVFDRFVQDSPVSVMVRGLLENTLSPRFLDELFANAAELQYTRTLLFSSVVDLMGLVVNRIQPAVNSAYHAVPRPLACRSSRSITNSTTSRPESRPRRSAPRQNGWRRSSRRWAYSPPTVAGLSHQDS